MRIAFLRKTDYNIFEYSIGLHKRLSGRQWGMENEIRDFILYLHEEKKTSVNTELSYKRDLQKLQSFLSGQGIEDVGRITETSLNSYVLYLEKTSLHRLLFPVILRL